MKAAFALLAFATAIASAQITCDTQRTACDVQLGANHACCSALYASCVAGTTTPDSSFGQCSNGPPCATCTATVPAATATSVGSACAAQQASCKSQIGANQSCCAALMASCLAGTTSAESPFNQCSNGPPCPTCTGTGTGASPTSTVSASSSPSSTASAACSAQQSACDLQVGANHACCASLMATCLAGTTTPDSSFGQCSNGPPCPTCTGTIPAATATSLPSACAVQKSSCQSQIGANESCCAALMASCLAGTTYPESPFSQCSNGAPCPTCTVGGKATLAPNVAASSSSGPALFTGAADTNRAGSGLLAAGLIIAALL